MSLLPPNIRIGEATYAAGPIRFFDASGPGRSVKIGSFTSLGENLKLLVGGEHWTDRTSTYPFDRNWPDLPPDTAHPKSRGPIVIGSDVWIGNDVTIRSGVTIGHGAVVGACSLVTRDVPPYWIVAGNPARFIRYRFPNWERGRLLEIAWWDWPAERVKAAAPLLIGPVAEFIRAVEEGRA